MKNLARALVCSAVLLVAGAAASQAAGPLYFSSPDFVWYHPSGGATPNHIWVAGDYWDQTFNGTGLANATALGLNIDIDDNILDPTQQVNLDVLLNGTNVGSFSIASGVTGFVSNTFLFSPVLALGTDSFDIKMLETNTIPSGLGSVSMSINQTSYATLRGGAVPEPNTLALVAVGALGLAGLGLRRRS